MEGRRYEQTNRAQAVTERRESILRAAIQRFMTTPYDDVTLELVAVAAGVSLKTVTRQFRSKEELFLAAAELHAHSEDNARTVAPGDVRGAVSILADRYELLVEPFVQLLRLEGRIPAVATMIDKGRGEHRRWLEATFTKWLGVRRRERVAALFAATEIYNWRNLRTHLGLSRRAAEAVLLETIEALIERWEREGV
jgi:AcrR family transcriptional regulator